MLLLTQSHDDVVVLRVGGPVQAADAPALERAVDDARAYAPGGVVIDLAHAQLLDPAAVDALRRAVDRDGGPTAVAGAPVAELSPHPDVDGAVRDLRAPGGGARPEVLVEHGPHGPSQARAAVERWAHDIGAEALCEDLKLIVSELVTNAVRYGRPPVRVAVAADERTVTVTVADDDPTRPVARPADDDAEGGRGLLLIELLAADHGVRDQPPGKAVWAALTRT